MRPEEEETFSPETVDEQVEQLSRSLYAIPSRQGRTADIQLVQNLHRMYELEQEDARSVARVQHRLEQQGWLAPTGRRTPRPEQGRRPAGRPTPAPGVEAATYRERPAPRPRGWAFRLATLAAVLLVTTLIGGLVVGLVLVHNGKGSVPGQGTATAVPSGPTATATPPPSQGAFYGLTKNAVVALNLADGKMRWQHPITLQANQYPSLFETDDAVYLQTNRPGTLIALNKSDGTLRWQKQNVFSVQAKQGLVVIPSLTSAENYIFSAFDAVTGNKLWTFQPPKGPSFGEIVLTDDTVYAATQDSGFVNDGNPHYFLYALDKTSGKQRWTFQSLFSFHSVAFGDALYVLGAKAPPVDLTVLNASDGTERWHANSTDDTEFYPPVVVNGVVYVPRNGYIQGGGGGSGVLLALRESDGKELWHSTPSQANVAYSEPTVVNGVAYVTDQKYVYAFNATNGSLLWQKQVGFMYDPPMPVVLGNLVYVQWFGSRTLSQTSFGLSALNTSNGQEAWRYEQPPSMVPSEGVPSGPGDVELLDGVILTHSSSGDVVALDATTGQQLWQTSIFNQSGS